MILGILIPVVYIILSGHIIWKSTDSFETAADYLGRNMSHGVKGATLNAVASSMPEFLTTMFFLFYIKDEGAFADSFSGGLGVVSGSAIFNILIIPVAVIFLGAPARSRTPLKINRRIFRRDGLFLIFSNIILIVLISKPHLTWIDGFILVVIYLAYLFLLRKGLGFTRNGERGSVEHRIPYVPLKAKHFLRLELKQVLLNGRRLTNRNAAVNLLVSVAVMSIGTWMLVEGTELLGKDTYSFFGLEGLRGLGLPIIFISVLLAAAATSIPDTMISVRDARKGNHDDSISNALGSNIFDISFALGLPLLLYTLINGGLEMSLEIRILSVSSWLIMWAINLVVIPLFLYSKKMTHGIGIVLLLLYLAFIILITAEVMKSELIAAHIETFLSFVNRLLGG